MKKIGWIILVFLLFSSCSFEKKITRNPYKGINYKQTHTQPHQNYIDKPTRIRSAKVRGHEYHLSRKIKRSESYGK